MIDFLEEIDRNIVLAINSWHNPVLDEVMWFISGKLTWIPLYLLLIYFAFLKLKWKGALLFIVTALATVAFTDLIATHGFKEVFLRYRPSHHLLLTEKLHFYQHKPGEYYKGGQYGFVSSHAGNFMAITLFVGLALKNYYPKLIYVLLSLAILVSFSRIYLGVHYFSDVFVGGMLGALVAYLLYRFFYLRVLNNFVQVE